MGKSTVLPALRVQLSPNRSSRNGRPVDLVVVHRPVGSYESAIMALCDPAHQASAHVIVGPHGREATQLVPWAEKAWACIAFNSRSDNIEVEDAAWTGADKDAWKVAARVVAFRLKQRGLPPRWVHGDLLQHGFTRHYDLGAAGGGHTDPTTSTLRWLRFVARVKFEYRRGGFRSRWGI